MLLQIRSSYFQRFVLIFFFSFVQLFIFVLIELDVFLFRFCLSSKKKYRIYIFIQSGKWSLCFDSLLLFSNVSFRFYKHSDSSILFPSLRPLLNNERQHEKVMTLFTDVVVYLFSYFPFFSYKVFVLST